MRPVAETSRANVTQRMHTSKKRPNSYTGVRTRVARNSHQEMKIWNAKPLHYIGCLLVFPVAGVACLAPWTQSSLPAVLCGRPSASFGHGTSIQSASFSILHLFHHDARRDLASRGGQRQICRGDVQAPVPGQIVAYGRSLART
ncbi:hypothetical protein N658DRAFT_271167 [Parathielavia hyrcaniae]|uniref:Uncharacterized protein n=1 Tax=Parathielavia hyrcaniae TaxID=113614 RepID=A0AAN6SXL3_9PEZI|nr:hypothetical protein N658DRAFT_271167 [Parathielavia hyrcaniae]